MIKYDASEHHQKQMFTCIFTWGNTRTVAYFWEDCFGCPPEADIEVLQLFYLIKVGEKGSLGMHDYQLRDLGREIVQQENYDEVGNRSRLWGQEAVDVLLNNQVFYKCLKITFFFFIQ